MATINELLQKAQSTNSPQVYEEIARMYYNGYGVPQDKIKAAWYFRQAGDLGSVSAQTCAGLIYYKGLGVAKDIKMAKKYLQPAAENGSVEALRLLGRMCYDGEYGFFTGKGKAFSYWMKASKLGDAESQFYVATSYLGDTWGEEQSYRKAAFWFMCAYQNRKAPQHIITDARDRLNKLSRYVDLDDIKDEVVTQTSHLPEPDIFSLRNDCFCN